MEIKMKAVIEKIIKTEEESRKAVEEARNQAERIILDAQKKAAEIRGEVKLKSYQEKQDLLRKSAGESAGKKNQAVTEASRRAEEILREKLPDVKQIAGKFFSKIL